MANIIFIVDAEEGHVLPSFGLAHSLKDRGHQVTYLGIVDNEDLVRSQGFSFHPIFEHIYYKGYLAQYKKRSTLPGDTVDRQVQNEFSRHVNEFMNGGLDELLHSLKADIYIVNTFLPLDILVLYYRYKARPVILTPFLREEGRTAASDCHEFISKIDTPELMALIEFMDAFQLGVESLEQYVKPLDTLEEIVICPRELEIDKFPVRKGVHYTGPSIRKEEKDSDIRALFSIPANKKIIYASMGSQPVRHGNTCLLFFRKIINALQGDELQDCHLILSIGPEFDVNQLGDILPNVSLARWVPQLEVLKEAAAAIIHGGLGSVKECIYFGVPMIVFPLGYDQPSNARRVAYHRLGLSADIKSITAGEIRSQLLTIMTNPDIKQSVQRMKAVFRQAESAQSGALIVERILRNVEESKMILTL